jgi:transposase
MSAEQTEEQARQRAAVIWRVRSGAITARQAARELGVSRKTYYQWEARAMEGMLAALKNQPAGRPVRIDAAQQQEQQLLTSRIQTLEQELTLARQTVEVKNILDAFHRQQEKNAAGRTGEKKRQSGST